MTDTSYPCYRHKKSGAALRILPSSNGGGTPVLLAETNQASGFLCVSDIDDWTEIDSETYDRMPGKVRKVSRVFFVGYEWAA